MAYGDKDSGIAPGMYMLPKGRATTIITHSLSAAS